MRKLILTFALLIGAFASMSAQQVCFWTNENKTLPIRIYVDEKYVGDLTAAFDKAPAYGEEGTLCVELTPGTHNVAAVNAYGYEYDGWPGVLRPDEGQVSYVKLRKNNFPATQTSIISFGTLTGTRSTTARTTTIIIRTPLPVPTEDPDLWMKENSMKTMRSR